MCCFSLCFPLDLGVGAIFAPHAKLQDNIKDNTKGEEIHQYRQKNTNAAWREKNKTRRGANEVFLAPHACCCGVWRSEKTFAKNVVFGVTDLLFFCAFSFS